MLSEKTSYSLRIPLSIGIFSYASLAIDYREFEISGLISALKLIDFIFPRYEHPFLLLQNMALLQMCNIVS